MEAVVANTGSDEPRRHTRDLESRCDLRAHRDGVGRLEHDGRFAPRVSNRNDNHVAGRASEALVMQPFFESVHLIL